MKTTFSARLLAAALLLTSATFAACSQGTDPADVNVERGANKDFGQSTILPESDTLSSTHVQPDTANSKTARELYERSNNTVDRDHNGVADSLSAN